MFSMPAYGVLPRVSSLLDEKSFKKVRKIFREVQFYGKPPRMSSIPAQFIPTRESLLSRLKNWDDDESWREFFQIYRGLILSTARKAGLNEQEAEEVMQETLISVAKTIKDFKYDRKRCAFKNWLGHLARKRIVDRYRKRSREPQLAEADANDTGTSPIERAADPASLDLDVIWDQQWQQQLLDAALDRVKQQVNPEQYQIFDFYVLRKMPVKKVTAALGVSISQVYLAKHRVSGLLRKEVKALEKKMG